MSGGAGSNGGWGENAGTTPTGQPNTLRAQLEYYFSEDNIGKDAYLRAQLDDQGFCASKLLAAFPRILNLTKGKADADAVVEAASQSPFLAARADGGVGRSKPYTAKDLGWTPQISRLNPLAKAHTPFIPMPSGIRPGKDVPDGKSFREVGFVAAVAPGHKTATGQQGKTDPEEFKKRKEEKQERKRVQAAREEANRRKRGALGSPMSLMSNGGGGGGGSAAGEEKPEGRREKRAKVAPNETEMKKGEFRNRLNICCRDAFFDKAMLVVEEMTAAGFPLNMEQYTQLIHLCASAPPDQWKEGEKLLAGVVDMKLTERLASGIIKLQCCLGNVDEALKCFDEMAAADMVRKRRTYAPLLAALGEASPSRIEDACRVFADSQTHLVDLMEEDFAALVQATASAPDEKLLYKVLRSMSELIYAIAPSTLATLDAAFAKRNRSPQTVQIDTEGGGTCPHCASQIRSIDLEIEELKQMSDEINQLARVGDKQAVAFDAFKSWLERYGTPDAIIDGANVGYYSLRVAQGQTLRYLQVDRVVQHFLDQGLKPLIVMHSRHFGLNVTMTAQDQKIVQAWNASGMLYKTPPKMNDDWFWLYAGVWGSIKKASLVMVSNDQMRDHHFQMLSTRKFLKWRERHWVNFHFDTNKGGRSPPILAHPSKVSLRMQQVSDEDESRWHFPLAESPGTWLCAGKP